MHTASNHEQQLAVMLGHLDVRAEWHDGFAGGQRGKGELHGIHRLVHGERAADIRGGKEKKSIGIHW